MAHGAGFQQRFALRQGCLRAVGSSLAKASAPSANGPRNAGPVSRLIFTASSALATASARRPAMR